MTGPIGSSFPTFQPVRISRPALDKYDGDNREPDRYEPAGDEIKVLPDTPFPTPPPGGMPGGAISPRFRGVLAGGRLPVLAEPVANSLLDRPARGHDLQ